MTNIKPPDVGRTSLNLRQISVHLRDQFKAYCAKRGRSMTGMLTQFMRDCVKKDGKGNKG